MPRSTDEFNQDIGENGRQPTDHSSSYWDELKRSDGHILASTVRSTQRPVANMNRLRDRAAGEC